MKLKKVFKSLAVGLLVVPCALAFTACGGNEVKIDTKMPAANTTTTTCAQATEYFENTASVENITNGYRMSLDVYSETKAGEFSLKTSTDAYGVVIVDESEQIGMSLEATIKINGEKEVINFYVKDNYVYQECNGVKIKYDIMYNFGDSFDVADIVKDTPSPEDMTKLFDESLGLKYDVYQNEGTTKFKIYSEDSSTPDSIVSQFTYEVYFVFENDVLSGVQYGMITKSQNSYFEVNMAMELYEGVIEYPSLEDYQTGIWGD